MKDGEVVVLPHDPEWVLTYRRIATRLRKEFAGSVARVDHIGSTSVRGLIAKPLIDINVGLTEHSSFDADVVARIGLQFRAVNPESVLFALFDDGLRVANVHVRYTGSRFERWDLLFRDYLISHPEAVHSYGEAKLEAARIHPNDREAYSAEKGKFIAKCVGPAEEWARSSSWTPAAAERPRVCAAVLRDGQVLMVRGVSLGADGRRSGSSYWTFPGGGIEAGEEPAAAAERELLEETGLHGKALKLLWKDHYSKGTLVCYLVEVDPLAEAVLGFDPELEGEEPELVELKWFPIPEVRDDPMVKRTLEVLAAHER